MTLSQKSGGRPLHDARVRAYLNAFSTAEPELVASNVTEGFVNAHLGELADGCEGRQRYIERLSDFLKEFEQIDYDITSIVCEGEEAVARYTMSFVQDGRRFEVPGMMWFEFEDGYISRRIDCWDGLTFLKQSGLSAPQIAEMLTGA